MSGVEILSVSGLSKAFPGVKALNNVDFNLNKGEILALLGGNGAGKSTLIKCMTGFYASDSGQILLGGQDITGMEPDRIQRYGISTVHQEVNLIPTLSVAENIYLGRQPKKNRAIDWKTLNRKAEEVLASMKIYIDVTQLLSSYSVAIQQMVAIARGIDMSAKVLILDEPTASLDTEEVEQLFSVMRRLADQGIGIVFVTHFLDQVYTISDRITILRNGHYIGSYLTVDLPQEELISKMLGKALATDRVEKKVISDDHDEDHPVLLKATGITKAGYIEPFDIEVRKGEVVGLAGLLGSGRTEVAKLMFGVDGIEGGELTMGNEQCQFSSPKDAIQRGIAFCPEDRKKEGLIGDLSVRENIILAMQAKRGWFNALSRVEQEKIAKDFIKALKIVTPDMEKAVKDLSGGNQQKVILARWLASEPSVLILDEPTRGIDVGAHREIVKIIRKLCEQGLALMVINSELEEVVEISDRIVVLKDRKQIGELKGNDVTESNIMAAIAKVAS